MYLSKQPLPPSVLLSYMGGHTVVGPKGYIFELCPDHPKANHWGFVPEHRLVYERHYGFYLNAQIQIHHKNRKKDDNHIDNLHACTRSEHMILHRAEKRAERLLPLDFDMVRATLQETKNLKKACRILGCHPMTIRNRFPELVDPYKRKSPSRIDDPGIIEQIRLCALNPDMGFRETAIRCGVHWQTVRRICANNEFEWVRKSKKGEIHSQYRRKKPSQPVSIPCVTENVSVE